MALKKRPVQQPRSAAVDSYAEIIASPNAGHELEHLIDVIKTLSNVEA